MIDQLVRSRRRTLALQITADAQLIVRAPKWASQTEIDRLVNDKSSWIRKKQQEVRAMKAELAARQEEQANSFLYLGELRPRVMAPEVLESWYRIQAREVIGERVALFSQRSGLTYSSLKITSAKTRWGSCSRQGTLNFTWRLVMAPLWVVDYVVAHEISHLAHHNHSRRFWQKVAELFPNFKEARRWLHTNQQRLTN